MLEKMQERTEVPLLRSMAQHLGMDPDSFVAGVATGRLYNSFYYQYRRICGRDPTLQETQEFVDMVVNLKDAISQS